jgi:hypothetical protein
MKSDISVLPLQGWMRYYSDSPYGRQENDLKEIAPILHRDGWYYNRRTKLEWYEYRGQAFLPRDNKQFVYELGLLNAKVLTARELRAYKELLNLKPPKPMRDQINKLLQVNKEIRHLRMIGLNGFRVRERFNKFKGAISETKRIA